MLNIYRQPVEPSLVAWVANAPVAVARRAHIVFANHHGLEKNSARECFIGSATAAS